MDPQFAELFAERWTKYFPQADLPLAYFYADAVRDEDQRETVVEHRCLIGNLKRVREGHSFVYGRHTPGCSGGKRYTGFTSTLRSKFEYFLSCGIPGEMEGERYKKSPELVQAYLETHPAFQAPGKYLVFKRWDKLAPDEQPFAVIFFASPDVLAGLFALANYDRADLHGVTTPMGSGCASIISHPLEQARMDSPACVLGLFDVSARPCVPAGELTFTVPMKRFEQMVRDMDESFLTTGSWNLVKQRVQFGSDESQNLGQNHLENKEVVMDENQPELQDALERLHAELERTKAVDPESRQLLAHLQGDIQTVLKQPTPNSRASLRARLNSAVAQFEDSHPNLTLTIKQVLDHLAEA